MESCNYVELIRNVTEDKITKKNAYQKDGLVCFNGYLARECFGNVYGDGNGATGLNKLIDDIGETKFDRIIIHHLDYIHGYIDFDTAKKNIIDILEQ